MSPDFVISIQPRFHKLIESPIRDSNGYTVGWHTTAIDKDRTPLGSGCSADLNTSRRIAVSETIERALYNSLIDSNATGFDFENHRSTDGFACGFDNEPTKLRAISEAVERWAWSNWIDFKKMVPKVDPPRNLSNLASVLLETFEKVSFYRISFPYSFEEKSKVLYFGITIAEKNSGVFPGSRVSMTESNLWEHCAVESARNLNILRNGLDSSDIIYQRIKYFGKNGIEAWKQIDSKKDENWSAPKIKLLKSSESCPDGVYLWRALCDNYIDWGSGSVERFVY